MGSSKHAKHAKPALHPTRSTLSVAATTVLLPLCLASPALADPLPTPVTAAATPSGPVDAVDPEVVPEAAAETSSAPVVQPAAAPQSLTAATPAAPAPAAPAASPSATTPVAVQAVALARTTMRISGPVGPVAAGDHVVGVRLLADGAHAPGGRVQVETRTAAGWKAVGTMVSDADGLAKQPFALPVGTTAVRAVFAGSVTQSPGETPTLSLTVVARKAAVTMRISGPAGPVAPGSHVIGVRLLADGAYVRDAHVRVERWGASGWEYAGRMITNAEGLARQPFGFASTTRVRALYEGSATRTTGVSPEVGVTIADFRQQAVRVASQQAGKPYRYGSVGPNSFDCSGLVKYAFSAVGKTLPRTSQDMLRATQRIANDAKQPGDLVFTHTAGRVGHVGIYAGDGHFWVAPRTGDVVKLQRIYTTSYYVGRVG